MKKHLLSFFILFIAAITFFSCVKDHFNVNDKFSGDIAWNPELAIPLIKAKLTLRDMLKERKDTLVYENEKNLGAGYGEENDSVLMLRFGIDTVQTVNMLSLPQMDPYDTTLYLQPVEIPSAFLKLPLAKKISDLLADNFSATDIEKYEEYAKDHLPQDIEEITSSTEKEYELSDPSGALSDQFEYLSISEGKMTLSCFNAFSAPIECAILLETDSAGVRKTIGEFPMGRIEPFKITNVPDLAELNNLDEIIDNYINNNGTLPSFFSDAKKKTITLKDTYIGNNLYYTYKDLKFLSASKVIVPPLEQGRLFSIAEFDDLKLSAGKARIPEQIIAADTTMYVSVGTEKSKQRLLELQVDRGVINYTIESEIDIATHFIFTFPTVTDANNKPQVWEKTIYPNTTLVDKIKLDDFKIDLTRAKNTTEKKYNSLPVELSYKVTAGGMTEFSGNQKIKLTVSNNDSIHFKYLKGNIGSGEEEIPLEEFEFDISEVLDIFDGEITFADPRLIFQFTNPIAMPVALDLNLKGTNDKGEWRKMFNTVNGIKTFDIESPSCNEIFTNKQAITEIRFDKNSTNIVELLKIMPNKLEYSGKLRYNSGDEDYSYENCITNEATVGLKVDVEVPLNVAFKDVKLSIDEDFDEEIDDAWQLDTLILRINARNQFPVEAELTIFLLDTTKAEDKQILDSLPIKPLLKAAAPDETGKVPRETVEQYLTEIGIGKGLYDAFNQSNRIRIEAKLKSKDNKPVIFYSYYGIDVQISVNGKILINEEL